MAASFIDQAAGRCRQAGFRSLLFRGDTDFTQTKHLDRWDDAGGIRFIFGIDARPNLVALAEALPASAYQVLKRPTDNIKTVPRQRPERHKARTSKSGISRPSTRSRRWSPSSATGRWHVVGITA